MLRRPWAWAVGLAVVAIALIAYRWRFVPPAGADDSARLRALEARLAALESRRVAPALIGSGYSQGGAAPVLPATSATPEPNGSSSSGGGKRTTPARAQVNEAALQNEYFGDLDARLSLETRDPVWAATTEERLRVVLSEVRPRINVDNMQCRQTMCRVATTVPESKDGAAALDKFLFSTATLMGEAVIRDGEAPGQHIVYLARPGTAFPPMESPETSTH